MREREMQTVCLLTLHLFLSQIFSLHEVPGEAGEAGNRKEQGELRRRERERSKQIDVKILTIVDEERRVALH